MAAPLTSDEAAARSRADGAAFPTTQWSLVFRAGKTSGDEAPEALERLCRRYWYPLYAFVRRSGRTHHEAQDGTQGFLAHLLAAGGLARAVPSRGRFRTFLIAALRNYLTDDWHRSHALKRGGSEPTPPLAFQSADERFTHEFRDTGLTPEQAFDRCWALSIVESALDDLRAEYAASGRNAVFEQLSRHVWPAADAGESTEAPSPVPLANGALRVAAHRFRRRLGDRIHAHVAATVVNPADLADELRYLLSAVGAQASSPLTQPQAVLPA